MGRAYSDGSQSTDFNPSGIEVQPHYRSSGYHNVEHIQTQSGSTSCYFDLNQYTLLNKTWKWKAICSMFLKQNSFQPRDKYNGLSSAFTKNN